MGEGGLWKISWWKHILRYAACKYNLCFPSHAGPRYPVVAYPYTLLGYRSSSLLLVHPVHAM